MRVLIVLLLGFASGLPLALSSSTLAIWLADSKIDLATIGLLSLAGLPYTFKFFWAPLVDALHIPVLSKLLGRRRTVIQAPQRSFGMGRFDLTDFEWSVIEPLLPTDVRGVERAK